LIIGAAETLSVQQGERSEALSLPVAGNRGKRKNGELRRSMRELPSALASGEWTPELTDLRPFGLRSGNDGIGGTRPVPAAKSERPLSPGEATVAGTRGNG
jgi:hypothetical protein